MNNGHIDYSALYWSAKGREEVLERELVDLRGLIRYLEPLALRADLPLGEASPNPPVDAPQAARGDLEPSGEGGAANLPYRGKTSPDAALAYLTEVGKPKTTREVADALKAGGIESDSPNFTINTYTSLKRLRKRGEIEQVGKGVWQAKQAAGE